MRSPFGSRPPAFVLVTSNTPPRKLPSGLVNKLLMLAEGLLNFGVFVQLNASARNWTV